MRSATHPVDDRRHNGQTVDRRHGLIDRRRTAVSWISLAAMARLLLASLAMAISVNGLTGRPHWSTEILETGSSGADLMLGRIVLMVTVAAAVTLVVQAWCATLRRGRWAFLPAMWLSWAYLMMAGVGHQAGLSIVTLATLLLYSAIGLVVAIRTQELP